MGQVNRLRETLLNRIATADLLPGEPLASERQLAQEFGLARSTVNEQLTLLASEGFLIRSQGSRSRVVNLFEKEFHQSVSELSLNSEELEPIFQLRAALEGEAAYYCALRASENQMGAIAVEYQAMVKRNQLETTLSRAKADLRFHTLIAESSHNLPVVSYSLLFYERFFNAIYIALDLTLKRYGKYPDGVRGQHAAIYQALMRRDAESARDSAKNHVLYTAARYKEALQPADRSNSY